MHHIYVSNDHALIESCEIKMQCVSSITSISHVNTFCWLNSNVGDWEKTALFMKKNEVPLVVVSNSLSTTEMQQALLYGARAYCENNIDHDTALAIIATIKRSGLWLPADFLSSFVGNLTNLQEYTIKKEVQSCLTKREVEVVNEVLNGKSNLAISESLGITQRTVKEHISSILHKFSVRDRVGLLLKLGEFKQIV